MDLTTFDGLQAATDHYLMDYGLDPVDLATLVQTGASETYRIVRTLGMEERVPGSTVGPDGVVALPEKYISMKALRVFDSRRMRPATRRTSEWFHENIGVSRQVNPAPGAEIDTIQVTIGASSTFLGYEEFLYGAVTPTTWKGQNIKRFYVNFPDKFNFDPEGRFSDYEEVLVSISGFQPFTAVWSEFVSPPDYPEPSYRASVPGLFGYFNSLIGRGVQVDLSVVVEEQPDVVSYPVSDFSLDFCRDGNRLLVAAGEGTPIDYVYYKRPENFSATVQTNWFTLNAGDVLLWAALANSAPFVKEDERLPIWRANWLQGVESLNAEDREEDGSGSSMVMELG